MNLIKKFFLIFFLLSLSINTLQAEDKVSYINIDLVWEGKDDQEKGINKKNNKVLVEIDPYYYRPTEVNSLVGDFSKAQKTLGWKPKVQFNELVEIMMRAELEK